MRKKKRVILTMMAMAAGILAGAGGIGGRMQSVQAAGRPVAITSCEISGDDVVCELKTGSVPASDDGKFYIYADEVYLDGTLGDIVAKVDAEKSVTASFPLNYDTEESNLSRKFLVAVKSGGEMVQVSDEHYITNPEVLASYTTERMNVGIKGILPDITRVSQGQLQDLGIQQVVYNMDIGEICSAASAPGAVAFPYNGKTYYFDGEVLGRYDSTLRSLNRFGMQITLVLLNGGEGLYGQDLIHPLAKGEKTGESEGAEETQEGEATVEADCPGYALNVADEEGAAHLKAIGAFLGQHYSGKAGCGQVDNFIIGNEVNARTSWWYTSSDSLEVNVNSYVKAFRILYNELKGMNANVRVYNSIDQEWNRKSNPGSFLAKEYLDRFNYFMNREGNIDWGLSYHPYNSPLYDPYAWNGPSVWVKDSITTPYITMQNIDILIDYMNRDEFLNPEGEVRSISLAEIGYTSAFGDEKQEASIAYGYLKAASLPDVDAFMLFRQTDEAYEMESHLALGLYDLNGNKKPSYEIYKKLGTADEAEAKERASEIIGMDIDEMINENIMWTREGSGVIGED